MCIRDSLEFLTRHLREPQKAAGLLGSRNLKFSARHLREPQKNISRCAWPIALWCQSRKQRCVRSPFQPGNKTAWLHPTNSKLISGPSVVRKFLKKWFCKFNFSIHLIPLTTAMTNIIAITRTTTCTDTSTSSSTMTITCNNTSALTRMTRHNTSVLLLRWLYVLRVQIR